jgi:maltose-6'-phosphate glucosidase
MKKNNVCIAGGASTYTPGIIIGLIKKLESFPVSTLVLYDNDEDRLNLMGGYAKYLLKDYAPQIELIYTTDKKKAFTNIDYVFCQIRTGGLIMREQDEQIPLKYGVIGQETCGPGGMSYGMRSIKDMIELVSDIRTYSKDAWILNYTNPAAIVAIALDKEYPNDKRILNICDQPISLLMAYSRLLGDVTHKELVPSYFGLNHFGWFTQIINKTTGEDLTQKLKDKIIKEGFYPADKEQRDPSWLVTYNAVSDMLKLDDTYLPNSYLQYYLIPNQTISHLDPKRTRAREVIEGREKRVFDECRRVIEQQSTKLSQTIEAEFTKKDAHGEMIVEIAESIYLDQNRPYIVMVRNNNIIEGLPNDAMVEVKCQLGKNGPIPDVIGRIPTYHKGLIENQYAYEKLIIEAYYEKSYKKALQALTLNRTVVDQKLAKTILDELIKHNLGYWPTLV